MGFWYLLVLLVPPSPKRLFRPPRLGIYKLRRLIYTSDGRNELACLRSGALFLSFSLVVKNRDQGFEHACWRIRQKRWGKNNNNNNNRRNTENRLNKGTKIRQKLHWNIFLVSYFISSMYNKEEEEGEEEEGKTRWIVTEITIYVYKKQLFPRGNIGRRRYIYKSYLIFTWFKDCYEKL